mmetsp:Transcript_13262/g.18010  ORF Transcript_13262/g.18010 Transcript_13262/m.18010 type:complete len:244 (-) Transcript_13262:918-1649(-)
MEEFFELGFLTASISVDDSLSSVGPNNLRLWYSIIISNSSSSLLIFTCSGEPCICRFSNTVLPGSYWNCFTPAIRDERASFGAKNSRLGSTLVPSSSTSGSLSSESPDDSAALLRATRFEELSFMLLLWLLSLTLLSNRITPLLVALTLSLVVILSDVIKPLVTGYAGSPVESTVPLGALFPATRASYCANTDCMSFSAASSTDLSANTDKENCLATIRNCSKAPDRLAKPLTLLIGDTVPSD